MDVSFWHRSSSRLDVWVFGNGTIIGIFGFLHISTLYTIYHTTYLIPQLINERDFFFFFFSNFSDSLFFSEHRINLSKDTQNVPDQERILGITYTCTSLPPAYFYHAWQTSVPRRSSRTVINLKSNKCDSCLAIAS